MAPLVPQSVGFGYQPGWLAQWGIAQGDHDLDEGDRDDRGDNTQGSAKGDCGNADRKRQNRAVDADACKAFHVAEGLDDRQLGRPDDRQRNTNSRQPDRECLIDISGREARDRKPAEPHCQSGNDRQWPRREPQGAPRDTAGRLAFRNLANSSKSDAHPANRSRCPHHRHKNAHQPHPLGSDQQGQCFRPHEADQDRNRGRPADDRRRHDDALKRLIIFHHVKSSVSRTNAD